MGMTVKQLADKLGVSKTAVRKRFTDEFREQHIQSVDGILIIDENGCKLIAESLKTNAYPILETSESNANQIPESAETIPKTSEISSNSLLQSTIDMMQNTIETLQGQLATKDQQIEALTAALSNAQQIQQQLTAALETSQDNQRKLVDSLNNAQALHAGTLQTIAVRASDSSQDTPQDTDGIQVPLEPENTIKEPLDGKKGVFSWLFKKRKKK